MKSKKSRERWERGKKILHPYRLDICYQTRLFYQWTLFNTGFLRPAGNECQRLFVYRPMPRSPCRLRLSLSSPGTHDIPNPLVFRPRSTESSRVTHRGSPRGRKRRGARNQGEGGGRGWGTVAIFETAQKHVGVVRSYPCNLPGWLKIFEGRAGTIRRFSIPKLSMITLDWDRDRGWILTIEE